MAPILDPAVTLSLQGMRTLKLTWAITLFAAKLEGPQPYASLEDAQHEVDIVLGELLGIEGLVESVGTTGKIGSARH